MYHAYCVYYIYCVLRIFYVHIYNVLCGTPEYLYIYIYTLGLNASNFTMVLPRGRGSSNFSTGSCYTQTIEHIRTLYTIISIYTYVYIYIYSTFIYIYIYMYIYLYILCSVRIISIVYYVMY